MTGAQVIERFSGSADQLLAKLRALPLPLLRRVLCALLLLWIVVSLAKWLWFFIADDSVEPAPQPDSGSNRVTASQPRGDIDIAALQAAHLFGEAGAQPLLPVPAETVASDQNEVESHAEKTRLNLTLEGIVYTADGEDAAAVILYQGKQEQYFVGDKLPVNNRVSLARVLVDHVILDNAGNYESLWLYDEEKKPRPRTTVARAAPRPKAEAKPANNVTDKRQDANATTLAKGYRDRLYKNPKSLAEVLRIAPQQRNGQLVGYRVSPGSDREQFTALGFKTNDVVTSINGIDLDEPSKALEIYKLMRTAKEASFNVERNGENIEVMVSLGEG